ncbi:MAG: class I SAM-dependent methyltransferase [Chloroflexi bacterium]|nr:class I SAM-dependent methyltransferase [Chloroflexota bacterium]
MPKGTTYNFVIGHLNSEIKEGYKVLETGCGATLYRDVVKSLEAIYIGTDVPNQHYGNLQTLDSFCSAENLPFADGSIDIVFNQGAIDYMPDLPATLQDAYRVLAPGGKMIIYTYRKDILEMIHENVMATARDWELQHHVFSTQELLDHLAQAGFRAKDVSFELKSWEPGYNIQRISEIAGIYSFFNRQRTRWRVFVADKLV